MDAGRDRDVANLLLTIAFRHRINEPNIEAGFERFLTLAGRSVSYEAFCDAVATTERIGLIREPIRLPEGALQCHWQLELTPSGVEAARKARGKATESATNDRPPRNGGPE
jgi:hypothetical protein